MKQTPTPKGGKVKKSQEPTTNPLLFIPPIGDFDPHRQFTRNGWKKVER